MRLRSFVLAALLVVLGGVGGVTRAQFAPMGGPAGPHPDMMGGYMPGPSPYAPPAFAPAAYAGIGGPAPMGPGPMGAGPMGPMPASPSDMSGYGGGMGGYCNDCCNSCGPRFHVFGEFLNLRPRNAEVAYAAPVIAGVGINGPISRVDPDYSPGFRVGFGAALGGSNAFVVTYSQLDSNTSDAVSLAPGGAGFVSLVSPFGGGLNQSLTADAALETQFKLLDLDYKGFIVDNGSSQIAFVIGARYANLEQHFAANFAPAGGPEAVLAESEFDGAGVKLGLEGRRFARTTQFFVFGKGNTSLVAGDFRTRYQSAGGGQGVAFDTSHDIGRIVTMLDVEAGVGWQNFTGNLELSLGYMFSSWYNTVKVNEWINAVQQGNFVDPSDNFNGLITFDGLTAKIQIQW